MRFLFLQALLSVLFVGTAKAQTNGLNDTITVEEVQAVAPYRRFQAGVTIQSILPEQIQQSQAEGLDKLLSRYAPVYIKSDASGISSIRVRGTSANHTTVNYGGININSLSLGSSNFSNIPVYLFDGFDLQYGSSSAVNGSGAIGGAIYLGLQSNWTDGQRVKATISEGAFGEQLYGAKVFVGNGKFESVTRAYYYRMRNDFPFRYKGELYDQQNASLAHYGLIQELNYKLDELQWIKTSVWIEHDWREQAWTMGEHETQTGGQGIMVDDATRFWSEYVNKHGKIHFKSGLGFVHDGQLTNENGEQRISTNRWLAELEANQDVNTQFAYKFGLKYKYISPDVYAYSSQAISYEQRADIYLMASYSAWNRLKLTLNLRQQFVTSYQAPFTPTFGAEYQFVNSNKHLFTLMGNVAHSYRIPTFNDRFWGDQGNPDLKPEQGMNYELALAYHYKGRVFSSENKLATYYMDIDDWIEWRPQGSGTYYPENRTNVLSKGVELSTNSELKVGLCVLTAILNYNYSPTEITEDDLTNRIGKELLYTPKHNGNAYFSLQYRLWNIYLSESYTGNRMTDYSGNYQNPDGNILPAFALTDIGLYRKVQLNKHSFSLMFAANNVFNKAYINQVGYAMPGRSFRFTLSSDLNFINSK